MTQTANYLREINFMLRGLIVLLFIESLLTATLPDNSSINALHVENDISISHESLVNVAKSSKIAFGDIKGGYTLLLLKYNDEDSMEMFMTLFGQTNSRYSVLFVDEITQFYTIKLISYLRSFRGNNRADKLYDIFNDKNETFSSYSINYEDIKEYSKSYDMLNNLNLLSAPMIVKPDGEIIHNVNTYLKTLGLKKPFRVSMAKELIKMDGAIKIGSKETKLYVIGKYDAISLYFSKKKIDFILKKSGINFFICTDNSSRQREKNMTHWIYSLPKEKRAEAFMGATKAEIYDTPLSHIEKTLNSVCDTLGVNSFTVGRLR